jgi:hypothetical protein
MQSLVVARILRSLSAVCTNLYHYYELLLCMYIAICANRAAVHYVEINMFATVC